MEFTVLFLAVAVVMLIAWRVAAFALGLFAAVLIRRASLPICTARLDTLKLSF